MGRSALLLLAPLLAMRGGGAGAWQGGSQARRGTWRDTEWGAAAGDPHLIVQPLVVLRFRFGVTLEQAVAIDVAEGEVAADQPAPKHGLDEARRGIATTRYLTKQARRQHLRALLDSAGKACTIQLGLHPLTGGTVLAEVLGKLTIIIFMGHFTLRKRHVLAFCNCSWIAKRAPSPHCIRDG